MSAYLTLLTPMIDQESLLAALVDLGFEKTQIEVHATPVELVGYPGERRAQTANIVVRRQPRGSPSHDVGFLATESGYQALVSGYDHPHFGTSWLSRLSHQYETHAKAKRERLVAEERRRIEEERQRVVEAQRQAVHLRAKKMGYRVEERREGDKLRLILVKRTY